MIDRQQKSADNVPGNIQTDRPVSFEEHFIAAYLVAMEGCDTVLHNVRHSERKHPSIAALGFASATRRYIGCDVLDWVDTWWPMEMNQAKVLPKLRERVKLFREMIPFKDSLRNDAADAPPQARYIFFSFSSPSSRILRALQSIENDAEVLIFSIDRVKDLARALAGHFASTDTLHDNHFVRTVRLLADEGRGAQEVAVFRSKRSSVSAMDASSELAAGSNAMNITNAVLDTVMQNGYDPFIEGRFAEACKIWLPLWDMFKEVIIFHGIHGVGDLETGPDEFYEGLQMFFNWFQDLADALEYAAQEDPVWWAKAMAYSREFRELLPNSDILYLVNMAVLEARGLDAAGRHSETEAFLEKLTREYPKSEWSWTSWGDFWAGEFGLNQEAPRDLGKALSIYERGLSMDVDDPSVLCERIEAIKSRSAK